MSETPDQASTRRRWVTLAELVAVAGVLIAAATLYLNWSDHHAAELARTHDAAAAAHAHDTVTLTGIVDRGGDTIALTDPAHTISDASVRFPAALGLAEQDAMPGPQVQADWIAKPLLKLVDPANERAGKLPVLITVGWWDGDVKRHAAGIYDLRWQTKKGMPLIGGRTLVLTGLSLRARGGTPAQLDRSWTPPAS